jgi:hypothetical protein
MDGWLIEGPEELAAVKDLDTMSDRAASIVVATLVEVRLSSAIKSWFRHDEALFDPHPGERSEWSAGRRQGLRDPY